LYQEKSGNPDCVAQNREGGFELSHMDEFIDTLLREERVCDVILPRIQVMTVLFEAILRIRPSHGQPKN
jgi:hypothetical protein